MREAKYTAIILKKQPFGESDELISFFALEAGKIRGLAKGVKKSLSKLQQKLQALFLVELTLTRGSLPKIIGAEVLDVFANLRQDLEAMKAAFYAVELVLKITADEHKNPGLFEVLKTFVKFLDSGQPVAKINLALAKFKLEVLEAVGLAIHYPKNFTTGNLLYFSTGQGGFSFEKSALGVEVPTKTLQKFLELKAIPFDQLSALGPLADNEPLQDLLSSFVEYQLERSIKSEKFLKQ